MAWIYFDIGLALQQLRYHALPRTAPVPAVPHYT
ncbi:SAM-dependent methyltransferase, partial [Stenotrophomonas maltophilia]